MYLIRIEHHHRVRNYTAENYFDASELFNSLTTMYGFVQVWQGDLLLSEYKN